jgi:hypothetical protein
LDYTRNTVQGSSTVSSLSFCRDELPIIGQSKHVRFDPRVRTLRAAHPQSQHRVIPALPEFQSARLDQVRAAAKVKYWDSR